eukprot:1240044-Amphidinium_carterae.2
MIDDSNAIASPLFLRLPLVACRGLEPGSDEGHTFNRPIATDVFARRTCKTCCVAGLFDQSCFGEQ